MKELFQLNTTLLFWVGFVPPLFAAVFAILTAIILHQDKITNYAWICGVSYFRQVHFPTACLLTAHRLPTACLLLAYCLPTAFLLPAYCNLSFQRAFLPSLSRIINLTLEGLVWQLCIFFHIPFRLLELSVGCELIFFWEKKMYF